MRRSTKFLVSSAALAVTLAFAQAASGASQEWTFCVASAPSGGEVWITDAFTASANRRALESAMQSMLHRRTGVRVLAQCPQPSNDKIAVVNAQTTAIMFNRKLGAILHEISERGFPPVK